MKAQTEAKFVKFIHVALVYFLFNNVASGAVRWLFSLLHLSQLIYLPILGLLICIGLKFFLNIKDNKLNRIEALTFALFAYGLVLGFCFVPLSQVLFGFYVLVPMLAGLSVSGYLLKNPEDYVKWIFILWLLAVIGVLLNYFVTMPWEGFEYEIAGKSIEGSRDWVDIGGLKRLAGFSRSSFDVAIQIQLLASLMLTIRKNWFSNLLIWLLSGLSIYLTTSKGILNVYMVLTPIVLLPKRALIKLNVSHWPIFFGALGIILPISTLFFKYESTFDNQAIANLTFSIFDRLNNMWPEAFLLMKNHGNTFLGRGFGALGTAQTYYEPELFNAGDNIFLYWMVIFGWPILIVEMIFLWASTYLNIFTTKTDYVYYILSLSVVVYGLTTNVVENAFFAFSLGITLPYLCALCIKKINEL